MDSTDFLNHLTFFFCIFFALSFFIFNFWSFFSEFENTELFYYSYSHSIASGFIEKLLGGSIVFSFIYPILGWRGDEGGTVFVELMMLLYSGMTLRGPGF